MGEFPGILVLPSWCGLTRRAAQHHALPFASHGGTGENWGKKGVNFTGYDTESLIE